MAGVDLDLVGQVEDVGVQAVVERGGHFPFPAGEIRPSDGADEQGIASKYEPGRRPASQVGDQQAEAVGGVARGVQHPDLDIADLDHLVVGERGEVELRLAAVGLVQAVGRVSAPRPPE